VNRSPVFGRCQSGTCHCDRGNQRVVNHFCAQQNLATRPHHLRREARKPLDVKARNCLLHVSCINHEEIPELPPNFNTAQSLSADEIADILLCRTPKSWQRERIVKILTPWPRPQQEIVKFMENIEMSEDCDGDAKKKVFASWQQQHSHD